MNSDNQDIQPQNPTEEANGNGQKGVSQPQTAETEFEYNLELTIPNPEAAEILKQVLEVDDELNADAVKREINVQGNTFHLKYLSNNPKKLRIAIGNILENVVLVLQTYEEFH